MSVGAGAVGGGASRDESETGLVSTSTSISGTGCSPLCGSSATSSAVSAGAWWTRARRHRKWAQAAAQAAAALALGCSELRWWRRVRARVTRASCRAQGKAGRGARLWRSPAQVEGCSSARLLCRAGMLGAEGAVSRERRLGLGGGVE